MQMFHTVTGNFVNNFAVHLIHQAIAHKVSKNFDIVFAVCGGAKGQIHMVEVGIIRFLFENLQAVFVNELLCNNEVRSAFRWTCTIISHAAGQHFLCDRIPACLQMLSNFVPKVLLLLFRWKCVICIRHFCMRRLCQRMQGFCPPKNGIGAIPVGFHSGQSTFSAVVVAMILRSAFP